METKTILHGIVQECADNLREDMRNAVEYGDSEAWVGVDTPHGYIDVRTDRSGVVCVDVLHLPDCGHACPTLEKAIREALPTWAEVEREYEEELEEELEEDKFVYDFNHYDYSHYTFCHEL